MVYNNITLITCSQLLSCCCRGWSKFWSSSNLRKLRRVEAYCDSMCPPQNRSLLPPIKKNVSALVVAEQKVKMFLDIDDQIKVSIKGQGFFVFWTPIWLLRKVTTCLHRHWMYKYWLALVAPGHVTCKKMFQLSVTLNIITRYLLVRSRGYSLTHRSEAIPLT